MLIIILTSNVNRPSWTNGNPNWAYRPGWSNHQSWVNGYWHGQNNGNWWNNGGGFMTGLAVGGIGAWGIGSAVYGWGYRPYVNPYIVTQPVVIQQPVPTTVVVQQPVAVQQPAGLVEAAPIDYSQPLNTSAAPPDPATADPAMQTFDAARAAFKAGNYTEALQQTDQVLKTLPSDAAINEFRALCLFALKQYDQAAATLYAVLSAGPGWDWTTLSGLYSSVDVYTEQVRALEDYRDRAAAISIGPVCPGVPLPHSGPHRGSRRRTEGGCAASARRSALGAIDCATLRRRYKEFPGRLSGAESGTAPRSAGGRQAGQPRGSLEGQSRHGHHDRAVPGWRQQVQLEYRQPGQDPADRGNVCLSRMAS